MTAKNQLLTTPPYQVEQSLKALGRNLRVARLRRNLTLEQVAEKIGTTRQAIAAAEHGKPSTTIAVYAGLLWALGMTSDLAKLADPATDEEGMIAAQAQERHRASGKAKVLDNDF